MFDALATLLALFYSWIPNYGVAIALLTIAVMIILTPLTLKGTRSMMMMQAVAPEMKRIQQQYKDDRQKLNEELLKFYKENNINPVGGCLPLLLQMPVFFILYRVLRGLTSMSDKPFQTDVLGVVRDFPAKTFKPDYISHSSRMFQDLVGKTQMKAFGLDLAQSSTKAMNENFGRAIPYIILIAGVAATSFIQQRQISGRNPAAQSNPQQQLMMKLGPIMITFISLVSPGGLVIYFFVSNLFRVGQQALISRTIYSTPEAKALLERQAKEAEAKAKAEAGQPKKSFMERMLGDAAPKVNEPRAKGANAKGANGKAANGKTAGGAAPAKPPLAKSGGGGRTTPPGARSSASRKKKKRK